MVAEFKAGIDPHEATARAVLGLTGELSDEERQKGKVLNFSVVYLGGKKTVCKQLGCTEEEAGSLLKAFHEARPGIKRLVNELDISLYARGYDTTIEEARGVLDGLRSFQTRKKREGLLEGACQRGSYIKLIDGRRLHPIHARLALNGLIQGGAAMVIKNAMRQADFYLQPYESHLVLSVHDELGLDVRESEKEQILYDLPAWMSHPLVNEIVDTPVDISVSYTSWAEKEAYGN